MPDRRTLIEQDEPRSRSVGPYIVLVILALLIATAASYFATRPPVVRITLQNYAGMSDSQAQQAIVNAGLNYHITRQSSNTVAVNHVIDQDPPANSQVPKGTTIALSVSSGKPTVGLRDVTGYTISDAQRDLAYDKFQTKVDRKYDPSAKDTVIAERPKAGTKVREGSTVTLVVSDGPAPIKMPRLKGLTIDKARALAARDAFAINVAETAAFQNTPPNVIAYQDVAPGTTVNADHSVTVNVAVSTGGGLANVPSVVNNDFVSANQALTKAGFAVDVSTSFIPLQPTTVWSCSRIRRATCRSKRATP